MISPRQSFQNHHDVGYLPAISRTISWDSMRPPCPYTSALAEAGKPCPIERVDVAPWQVAIFHGFVSLPYGVLCHFMLPDVSSTVQLLRKCGKPDSLSISEITTGLKFLFYHPQMVNFYYRVSMAVPQLYNVRYHYITAIYYDELLYIVSHEISMGFPEIRCWTAEVFLDPGSFTDAPGQPTGSTMKPRLHTQPGPQKCSSPRSALGFAPKWMVFFGKILWKWMV